MLNSLTYEYTVKRISMKLGEFWQVSDSLLFERKRVDPVTLTLPGYIGEGWFRQGKPTQLVLDQDLPERDDTEPHFVVRGTDGLAHMDRKPGICGQKPEKGRRVDKQPQLSKSFNTSSGSGSSKSAGT